MSCDLGKATEGLENLTVTCKNISTLASLAQMVACLPLVQQVRGSIPRGVVNFHFKFLTSELGGVEMYTF